MSHNPISEELFRDICNSGNYHIAINGDIWTRRIPNSKKRLYEDRWIKLDFSKAKETEYFAFSYRNRSIYIHCLVYWYFNNGIPMGWEIDHKNRNRHDNSLANLESVTIQMNQIRRWSGIEGEILRQRHTKLFLGRKFSPDTIQKMKEAQKQREINFVSIATEEELDARLKKMRNLNKIANTKRWGEK